MQNPLRLILPTAKPDIQPDRKPFSLRVWLRSNLDTVTAGLFVVLLTSPALLEALIVKPSLLRELAVLGLSFVLWLAAEVFHARRTGLTLRHVVTFLKKGGRLWELVLLVGWVAFLGVNVLLRRGVNAQIPFGYFAFLLAVYLIDLGFAMTGRQNRQRRILYLLFAVFAVACFRGMFVLAANPDAARLLSTGSFPEADRHVYHLLGVGGFEFFTGAAIAFPLFVYYRMESRWHRVLTVCVGLILLGMLFASYTMPIVFVGLGILTLLVYSLVRLRGRELRVLSLLCVILLVIIVLFMALGSIFELYQSHLYLIKISDVFNLAMDKLFNVHLNAYDPGQKFAELTYQEGSSIQRLELYRISWRTFFENPLFGVGSRVNTGDYSQVGLHASWPDYLAMFGAPFALFLGFLALLFRRLHRMTATHTEKAYRMVAFFLYLLYGLVNPVIATAVFPVVLMFFVAGRVELPGEERPWLAA